MICPNCLDDYEFIRFEVDAVTLEHRGVFRCGCEDGLVLPESITKEIITDRDLTDQVLISRQLHLRMALTQTPKVRSRLGKSSIHLRNIHLERYLKDFSAQSLRHLFK